jgi:hypothetical protein
MGAKANSPNRKGPNKRPAALPTDTGPASSGNKIASRAERVSKRNALKNKDGRQRRRLFPESVPPAMVAEVFDVTDADDDAILSSVPPPPPARPHERATRALSKPPAPHPPRPSAAPAPIDDGDAPELAPEDLEVVDEGMPSNPPLRTSVVTPMPTEAPARIAAPVASARGAWWAIGAAALLLGVVLGVRQRAATRATESPPAVEGSRERPPADVGSSSSAPTASVASLTDAAETPADPGAVSAAPPIAVEAAPPVATESSVAPAVANAILAEHPHAAHPLLVAADGTPFDTQAASAAIAAAFQRAASCRVPGDEAGAVTATLTYAPSGRVTSATVSGVFAGTVIGGCVASVLRSAQVPPFSGEHLTVKRTVELR